MEGFVSKLADKISRYEIINNLIPGSALCFILNHMGYPILEYNTGVCIVICYLVGLANGRLSSLVIEWLCRKTKFIKWRSHESYNTAKKEHPFVETLQEIANMYRAFISVFLISIVAYVIQLLLPKCQFLQQNGLWILLLLLLILFLFSYRKQVNDFVVKDIDEVVQNKDIPEQNK